jgi:hypothetical protein
VFAKVAETLWINFINTEVLRIKLQSRDVFRFVGRKLNAGYCRKLERKKNMKLGNIKLQQN